MEDLEAALKKLESFVRENEPYLSGRLTSLLNELVEQADPDIFQSSHLPEVLSIKTKILTEYRSRLLLE